MKPTKSSHGVLSAYQMVVFIDYTSTSDHRPVRSFCVDYQRLSTEASSGLLPLNSWPFVSVFSLHLFLSKYSSLTALQNVEAVGRRLVLTHQSSKTCFLNSISFYKVLSQVISPWISFSLSLCFSVCVFLL